MVRGHAKEVSQQKRLAKEQDKLKSVKRTGSESRTVVEAGLTLKCPNCLQSCPNVGVLRAHFENKHPKLPLPPECLS